MVACLNEYHDPRFAAYHGDCVDVLRQLPDASIDCSIFSPPFSGLYIYNDSVADMGNTANDEEFISGYGFLARELHRLTRPGRMCIVHCKDLVYYRTQRGTAGLRDFPGQLIRAHIEAGFDFHSRVTIWRDPVREMQKTKAHGLLWKQLRADSTFSRQGLPEYLVIFRKWAKEGEEIAPVTHTKETFPVEDWQRIASPVWMDTRETDVLNSNGARTESDEKHICPLPLDIIRRALRLYTNTDDVVLSPFMGIGSEGFCAVKMGRRFIGVELKEQYWKQACQNINASAAQGSLFFEGATA